MLRTLKYASFDKEKEPSGDAIVELPSGQLVLIREYSSVGKEGGYVLYQLGRKGNPREIVAEFRREVGLDESDISWLDYQD